jgi:very-short-patch-repair endonuclease
MLWQHLRRKQLGVRILRQYSIDKFVIDFYSPEIKLAIELDGGVHTKAENREYDIKRQKYIEKFGITFCRITNEEYEGNPEKALKKIEAAVKALSTSKHEPLPSPPL